VACGSLFTARCTILQSAVLRSLVVCPSVRPSVTLEDHSWPYRLKILETNRANNQPNIFALRSPKVIHQLLGEHGEILGRKCSFVDGQKDRRQVIARPRFALCISTYVHNVRLNWVNRELHDLRWCGCLFTFVGASRGHLCDHSFLVHNPLDAWNVGYRQMLIIAAECYESQISCLATAHNFRAGSRDAQNNHYRQNTAVFYRLVTVRRGYDVPIKNDNWIKIEAKKKSSHKVLCDNELASWQEYLDLWPTW